MTLTEPFEIMAKKEHFTSGTGASLQQIEALERELGVTFSAQYIEFLRRYSYAWWFGHSILGIAPGTRWDAARHTIAGRAEAVLSWFAPFPLDVVVIEVYDGGGYYVLHSTTSSRAGTVSGLYDDTGRSIDETWPDFESFLAYMLK